MTVTPINIKSTNSDVITLLENMLASAKTGDLLGISAVEFHKGGSFIISGYMPDDAPLPALVGMTQALNQWHLDEMLAQVCTCGQCDT